MKPPLAALRSGLALALAAGLAACGTPSSSPTPRASVPGSASSVAPSPSTAPSAAPSEPSPDATVSPPARIADLPGALALELVAEGVADPIGFATTPDGWLLVHERDGRVLALDTASGATSVVLDISDRVLGNGEQGLLGLAFHPAWPEDGRAFVHYTDAAGNTVLSAFTGRNGERGPILDAASESVLLTVEQPFPNHNGGQLAFGPDGYLWMALGDGGSGGDPIGHGQDASTLLGSILRLDVDAADGERPYGIPAGNPYAAGGGAPENYFIGLRNPWRFSFDPDTGLLWVADVGQEELEEVSRLDPSTDAGANLGWSVMEGTRCFADAGCSPDGLVLPIAEYDHSAGCSITGGEVYRGDAIGSLWGWYVFSDYCSGTLFGVRSDAEPPGDGTALAPTVLLETEASVSAIGVDGAGELYLADIATGAIYRIVGG